MEMNLLTFANTHFAVKAEQLLQEKLIPVSPMPLPVKLGGSLCGICLRIPRKQTTAAVDLLTAGGAMPAAVYQIDETDGNKEYLPWLT